MRRRDCDVGIWDYTSGIDFGGERITGAIGTHEMETIACMIIIMY
jgi:hypothetical protein